MNFAHFLLSLTLLSIPVGFAMGSALELTNLDASKSYSLKEGDLISTRCPVIVNGRCRSTSAPRG